MCSPINHVIAGVCVISPETLEDVDVVDIFYPLFFLFFYTENLQKYPNVQGFLCK